MELVQFKLGKNRYVFSDSSGADIGYIGVFFDEIESVSFFKKWLLDHGLDNISGNSFSLEKEDGEVVFGVSYEDEEGGFVISKGQFMELLNDWKQVSEKRPQEINIINDNGYMRVAGKHFPSPPHDYFEEYYWPAKAHISEKANGTLRLFGNFYYSVSVDAGFGASYILITLLADDISLYGNQRYRQWLESKADKKISGDSCFLIKQGNYVVIKDSKSFKNRESYFTLTCAQFKKLLDDWEKIWEQKPPYIFVECNNGDVTFTPMDEVPKNV